MTDETKKRMLPFAAVALSALSVTAGLLGGYLTRVKTDAAFQERIERDLPLVEQDHEKISAMDAVTAVSATERRELYRSVTDVNDRIGKMADKIDRLADKLDSLYLDEMKAGRAPR